MNDLRAIYFTMQRDLYSNGGRKIGRNNGENEGVFAWNRVDEAVEIQEGGVGLEWTRPSDGEPRASVSCIPSENDYNFPMTEMLIYKAELSRKHRN